MEKSRLFGLTLLVLAFFLGDWIVLLSLSPGDDWGPLWAAGRLAWSAPAMVYDFAAVAATQSEAFGREIVDRPFVYPPTALIIFSPLGLMPLWISFALFVSVSLAALASQVRYPVLLLVAPPLVLAALAGQPTLLVAALTVAACLRLERDPIGAGILFAAGAMIKPQLLILVPLALVAWGNWRALWAAVMSVVAGVALSLIVLGPETWSAWFAALPRFHELFNGNPSLVRNAVSPSVYLVRFGVDPGWVIAAGSIVAVAVTVFARTAGPVLRSGLLLGGALLVTPYAMNYELAALAPAVLSKPPRSLKDFAIPFVWAASLFAGLSVAGLIAAYAWLLVRLRPTIRAWSAGSTLPPDSTTTMPSAGSTLPARTAASATAPPGSTTSSCASQA